MARKLDVRRKGRRRAAALAEAVALLRRGKTVAFPTETVYGLCVSARDKAAVARLYRLKGRRARKACAFLLPDRAAAEGLVGRLPPLARRLADRFWPGPLTLVVGVGKRRLAGLRVPGEETARELARRMGSPLLQTSANRSGKPAALNAAAVAASLGAEVDLILDGGRARGGRSSTVVRCYRGRFEVLREGLLLADEIAAAATRLVLLACTGNLCRSPLAASMLRRATAQELRCPESRLESCGLRFGSFGIMTVAGRPASEHARTVAREYGLDLESHRSHPFGIALLQKAALVFGMAGSHLDFLRPYFGKRPEALQLFDPEGREIPDPYGRPLATYRKVAEAIHAAALARARELAESVRG